MKVDPMKLKIPSILHPLFSYLSVAACSVALFTGCGQPAVKKLDDPHLSGTYLYSNYHRFKGKVLSVSTESISNAGLPVLEDSLSLMKFIDERLRELVLRPLKSITTFSTDGKIVYESNPRAYDYKYDYDENGYRSAVLALGGETKILYYKPFFRYHPDTTSCTVEKYKMKRIVNYEYGQGLDYRLVDSLNAYGPDTTDYLYERTEYRMRPSGLRRVNIQYDDLKHELERKTMSEYYDDRKLRITYEFVEGPHRKKAWMIREDLNEYGRTLRSETYDLNERNALENNFDFDNKDLRDLDFTDQEIFDRDKVWQPLLDEEGNGLGDENDSNVLLLDEQGNWDAKILFESAAHQVVKGINIRAITYHEE